MASVCDSHIALWICKSGSVYFLQMNGARPLQAAEYEAAAVPSVGAGSGLPGTVDAGLIPIGPDQGFRLRRGFKSTSLVSLLGLDSDGGVADPLPSARSDDGERRCCRHVPDRPAGVLAVLGGVYCLTLCSTFCSLRWFEPFGMPANGG